ncbi:hypothetical protein [Enterococcus avium]|uniref:hypothetical protein n=1 Tax=Enterococcus avium TaxID=33945 RepID=UPI001F56A005|nr:hypothetical protein [Enterococcus avium]
MEKILIWIKDFEIPQEDLILTCSLDVKKIIRHKKIPKEYLESNMCDKKIRRIILESQFISLFLEEIGVSKIYIANKRIPNEGNLIWQSFKNSDVKNKNSVHVYLKAILDQITIDKDLRKYFNLYFHHRKKIETNISINDIGCIFYFLKKYNMFC